MIGVTCASASKCQNSSEYLYVSQAHQESLCNEEKIPSAECILEVLHLFFVHNLFAVFLIVSGKMHILFILYVW